MRLLILLLVVYGPVTLRADDSTPQSKQKLSREAAEMLFVAKVKPLLSAKCFACHGGDRDDIQGELDLTTRAGMLTGGESEEAAIVAGDPSRSLLHTAIRWEDGYEMPPKDNDRLTAAEIDYIAAWIRAGAPWPDPKREQEIRDQADERWNSADGVKVVTSGGTSAEWTNRRYDPADLWAYQSLSEPTVPDVGANHPVDAFLRRRFLRDEIEPAPEADARTLVRRLHYDLTGLPPEEADLRGLPDRLSDAEYRERIDQLLASEQYGERMAQHWLDVVRYADTNGFARDEFRPQAWRYRDYVIEAFNSDKPFDQFVREQIAADELKIERSQAQAAVGFLWMGPWEHTGMSVAAETRQLWLDDVTNSVGVTFLAQELRCAKCHDHKFDPIPTRDYYSIQAIFASTAHSKGKGNYEIRQRKADPMFILTGGSLESPSDPVRPGILSGVASDADIPTGEQNRRRALADWIASPKNPLTARVIVNRVWAWHFGVGLVPTANNFGKTGTKPSHPELLDWLAGWFIENDWSIKKLHRLILTSNAYRRSARHPDAESIAKIDPAGRTLWRFPPRRLSAEEVRDSLLNVSGELNPRIGGESVWPEINWEVAFQPRLLMGKLGKPYEPDSKPADRNRRSLYAVKIRGLRDPLMEVLNQPGTEAACERRDETTVTPQVFTLLHGEFVHERSLALAKQITESVDSSEDRIREAFRRVYLRDPSPRELQLCREHVASMTTQQRNLELKPEPLPTSVTLDGVEEDTGAAMSKTFPLKKLENYTDDVRPWDVDAETRALANLCLILMNSSEFLYVY